MMEAFSQRHGKILLLLFLGVCQSEGSSPTCDIRGVEYTAIDLNITLLWNPCDVQLLENETILYTVVHCIRRRRVIVPHCTNITSTSCYLVPLFPTGDEFRWTEYFLVKFTSSIRSTLSGESKKEQFANWAVGVSSPVIYSSSATSSNITVWVHGPLTPYIKDNKTRWMGDPSLARELGLKKIFFKSRVINLDDPVEEVRTGWTPSDSGEEILTYSNLLPYTSYLVQVRCKLGAGGSVSGDVTDIELRTKQQAPEFGPRIANHTVIKRSCDHRDVLIHWEEIPHQRPNVEIISYTLTWKDSISQDVQNATVPANNRSTVAPNMIRFHEYHVTVSSRNSAGSKEGEKYIIENEIMDEESYQPTDMAVEQISRTQWNLTWKPPTEHQKCITGYQVVTQVFDSIEEEIVMEGYHVTSTLLHFMRVGSYVIELSSIVNDIPLTRSTVTIEYHVEGWKIRQWSILCAIMLLLIFTVVAVTVMSKKVCCDLSRLPDISKSRSMRLASANEPFISALKTPPEPEVFHSTQANCISATESTPPRSRSATDDVFEPNGASTETLLGSLHANSSEGLDSGAALMPTVEAGRNDSSNVGGSIGSSEFGGGWEQNGVDTISSQYKRPKSGYVRSAPKTKPSLIVYIPRHISSMKTCTEPHSSSADSGICTSPYIGSTSDYVPVSPASDSNGWCGYDFQSESPYVATSAADKAYRSESTLSEVDQESVGYRKVDPQYTEGYLPMSPFSTINPETISPSMDPYSKACPKPKKE